MFILDKKIKPSDSGYAMYIVLVVLLIAGIFFSISVRMSGWATVFISRQIHYLQAGLLAESGIARAEYFLNGGDNNTFDYSTDSLVEQIPGYGKILLQCNRWGGLTKVNSIGYRRKKEYAVQGILGRDIPGNISPRITLSGHIGGLVMDFSSSIEGTVVIHHGSVKRNNNYSPIPGSESWVMQRESPALPFDLKRITTFIEDAKNALEHANGNKNGFSGDKPRTMAIDSLVKKQDTIVFTENWILKNRTVENAVVVVRKKVEIGDGAVCRNCVVISKNLFITGGITTGAVFFSDSTQRIMGGNHESQFIATDSIIIGGKAQSPVYSLWISKRIVKRDTIRGGIFFQEKGDFHGHALSFTDSTHNNIVSGLAIFIADGCVFHGTIITDGDVQMKNITLHGNVWARAIVTVKDDIGYTNWLFGCHLQPLDGPVPFPLLGELPAKVWIASQ
jgi:hypothetical protein